MILILYKTDQTQSVKYYFHPWNARVILVHLFVFFLYCSFMMQNSTSVKNRFLLILTSGMITIEKKQYNFIM